MPITEVFRSLCCCCEQEDKNEVVSISYRKQKIFLVEGVQNASFEDPKQTQTHQQTTPEETPSRGVSSFGIGKKENFHHAFDQIQSFESFEEMKQFVEKMQKSASFDDEAIKFNSFPRAKTERITRIVVNVDSDSVSAKDSSQPQQCKCENELVKLNVLLPTLCCDETKDVQFFASTAVKTKTHINNTEDVSKMLNTCIQDAAKFFEIFKSDEACALPTRACTQGGAEKLSKMAKTLLKVHEHKKHKKPKKGDEALFWVFRKPTV